MLLCKINLSLCQINKSVEVDYYKVEVNGAWTTIIPQNFSKATGDYLEEITKRYTFSERNRVVVYDDLPIFDLRSRQPEINLYKVRFDSATDLHSMVKYVEIKNVFRTIPVDMGDEEDEKGADGGSRRQCLVFIADNVLFVEETDHSVVIRINKIPVDVETNFFNEAISFRPCFKYEDSEDVILFASPNIRYLVDQGGQFCTDYYGMSDNLVPVCVRRLNDNHRHEARAHRMHRLGRGIRRPE